MISQAVRTDDYYVLLCCVVCPVDVPMSHVNTDLSAGGAGKSITHVPQQRHPNLSNFYLKPSVAFIMPPTVGKGQ